MTASTWQGLAAEALGFFVIFFLGGGGGGRGEGNSNPEEPWVLLVTWEEKGTRFGLWGVLPRDRNSAERKKGTRARLQGPFLGPLNVIGAPLVTPKGSKI